MGHPGDAISLTKRVTSIHAISEEAARVQRVRHDL